MSRKNLISCSPEALGRKRKDRHPEIVTPVANGRTQRFVGLAATIARPGFDTTFLTRGIPLPRELKGQSEM
jgi:hypothetical protein